MKFIFRTFFLLMLGLATIPCYAFEGHATSKDGNLKVNYKVVDGYRVTITINTKIKKLAYQKSFKTDVGAIDIFFIDVNKDGYQDVMIQYADETGYTPEVLLNHDNLSFTNALMEVKKKFATAIYVNTEVDLIEEGVQPSGVSYQLKDMSGDGVPELIFYNTFIEYKGYRYVAFQLDRKKMNYRLYKKGKVFVEQQI